MSFGEGEGGGSVSLLSCLKGGGKVHVRNAGSDSTSLYVADDRHLYGASSVCTEFPVSCAMTVKKQPQRGLFQVVMIIQTG